MNVLWNRDTKQMKLTDGKDAYMPAATITDDGSLPYDELFAKAKQSEQAAAAGADAIILRENLMSSLSGAAVSNPALDTAWMREEVAWQRGLLLNRVNGMGAPYDFMIDGDEFQNLFYKTFPEWKEENREKTMKAKGLNWRNFDYVRGLELNQYWKNIPHYTNDVSTMVAAAMDAVLAARRGVDPQKFLNEVHAIAGKSTGNLANIGIRYPAVGLVLDACMQVLETQAAVLVQSQQEYETQIKYEVDKYNTGYNSGGSGAASAPNMGTTRRTATQLVDGTYRLSVVGPDSRAPTVDRSAFDPKFAIYRTVEAAKGRDVSNTALLYMDYTATLPETHAAAGTEEKKKDLEKKKGILLAFVLSDSGISVGGVTTTYVIQADDSLSGIAEKFGIADWRTIYDDPRNAAFKAAHPNPNAILAGEIITIPQSYGDLPIPAGFGQALRVSSTVDSVQNQLQKLTGQGSTVSVGGVGTGLSPNIRLYGAPLSTVQKFMYAINGTAAHPGNFYENWESMLDAAHGTLQDLHDFFSTRAEAEMKATFDPSLSVAEREAHFAAYAFLYSIQGFVDAAQLLPRTPVGVMAFAAGEGAAPLIGRAIGIVAAKGKTLASPFINKVLLALRTGGQKEVQAVLESEMSVMRVSGKVRADLIDAAGNAMQREVTQFTATQNLNNFIRTYTNQATDEATEAIGRKLIAQIPDATLRTTFETIAPNGKLIGEAGGNFFTRNLDGGINGTKAMFNKLIVGGTKFFEDAGRITYKFSDGHFVTFRPLSDSGPPAIEVNGILGFPPIKYHFPN